MLGAATLAAGIAGAVIAGTGGSKRSPAACEEAEKSGKGEESSPIQREDSRSAMWPNRDRPSETNNMMHQARCLKTEFLVFGCRIMS